LNIPINISIENETSYKMPVPDLQALTALVLQAENVSPNSFVNLLITKDEKIRSYNYSYRGVDSTTDVLAFPSEQNFLPLLGDILIDIDACLRQKGNQTWQEELEIVYLHGLLHLLGYEHVSQKQRKVMEMKEKKYWKIFKGEYK